jgi:hypothetical protein
MRTRLNPLPRIQTFARNHKILTVFLLLFGAPIATYSAWSVSASTRGKVSAHLDLRRGQYTLLLHGLPMHADPEFRRILKDRYGVDSKRVGYCVTSFPVRAYADSYNEVVAAAIERKFHRDVILDAFREASENTDIPYQ